MIPESVVNKLARETGAVLRQRRIRIYELVWVLVLGFGIGRKRTLAALRRSYERQTGQTIEESSFTSASRPASPGCSRSFWRGRSASAWRAAWRGRRPSSAT